MCAVLKKKHVFMCWVHGSGILSRFSTPRGIVVVRLLYPIVVVDSRLYNGSDVTYVVSIPYGRLVVNAQYWKRLVGLSRAGIPKEVC